MNKAFFFIFITSLLFFSAKPALADVFSVTADIPLLYSPSGDLDSSGVSGFLVGLSTPFLVGLGYESYDVEADNNASLSVNIVDVFVNLPVPLVNISLGYGIGAGDLSSGSGGAEYDTAVMNQFFARVGYPILVLFDVHVGYHYVLGTAEAKTSGVDDVVLDGSMLTIGAKVGF